MKYALVDGYKTEPQPNLRGICIYCQNETVSKCGPVRVKHWAHKSKILCDSWWENETEWHRAWKNCFPEEWQEHIHHDDQSGKKHIADVRTAHGLIIEFQHSHLDPQERSAREQFYKNMVWVVDGTRLKSDYKRFLKGIAKRHQLKAEGFFLLPFPDECFPNAWVQSTVPILFDFRGATPANPTDMMSEPLWCLLPGRAEGRAVIAGVSRDQFIQIASERATLLPANEIVNACAEQLRGSRRIAAPQFIRSTGMRRHRRM